MSISIAMPRLSDSMQEGTVLRWHVHPGDRVEVGTALADLEIVKSHVELQACETGIIAELLAEEGQQISVGTPIAVMQSDADADNGAICSPLARRLAASLHIDTAELTGTGPRGKIMACDVRALAESTAPTVKVQTPPAPKCTRHVTRVDDFYLYTIEADMAYLAAISTPIAVQCEHLIGGRYSLFDYVVRSAVRACLSEPALLPSDSTQLLLVLDKGEKYLPIDNAAKKTIFNIATERRALTTPQTVELGTMSPHILLCDTGCQLDQQRRNLATAPHAIISIGGTSPKTGIEAGRPVSKLMLPVTLCVNARIVDEPAASRVAAEFKTLLENPVLLLL